MTGSSGSQEVKLFFIWKIKITLRASPAPRHYLGSESGAAAPHMK